MTLINVRLDKILYRTRSYGIFCSGDCWLERIIRVFLDLEASITCSNGVESVAGVGTLVAKIYTEALMLDSGIWTTTSFCKSSDDYFDEAICCKEESDMKKVSRKTTEGITCSNWVGVIWTKGTSSLITSSGWTDVSSYIEIWSWITSVTDFNSSSTLARYISSTCWTAKWNSSSEIVSGISSDWSRIGTDSSITCLDTFYSDPFFNPQI